LPVPLQQHRGEQMLVHTVADSQCMWIAVVPRHEDEPDRHSVLSWGPPVLHRMVAALP
jgi:hypothetical protein